MRAYTVATVAVALDVPAKWVDNVLSHHTIPGVDRARQGIARRLTIEAVTVLEIALRLSRTFGMPVAAALHIAQSITGSKALTPTFGEGDCSLTVDTAAVRAHVAARLADAVEFAPLPRRGRPRKAT